LAGASASDWRGGSTKQYLKACLAPDLVNRYVVADNPNRRWAAHVGAR
jgi:hypothetical protein